MVLKPTAVTHFATPDEWRAWLEAHHAERDELWVGFWKKATGKPSITWPESVREALCFGWIDGIRKSVDGEAYTIRFTPRRSGSHWSNVNVGMMEELLAEGRVAPAGQAAWEARDPDNTGQASFEQEEVGFTPEQEKRFRQERRAWRWFQDQGDYYRRAATWWVVSAKRADTRERRLAQLIQDSAAGLRIKQLRP